MSQPTFPISHLFILVFSADQRDAYNVLGAVYRETGEHDLLLEALEHEMALEMREAAAAASPSERLATARALAALGEGGTAEVEGGGRLPTPPPTRPRTRVAIFCKRVYSGERDDGSWRWGPHAKSKGIGGSESAVISISNELARRGYAVEVYAHPPEADIGAHNLTHPTPP